jgi:hypothetical protein
METTHSRFFLRAAGLAVVVAVLGAAVWIAAQPAPRVEPKPSEAVVIDKSQRAQAERKALIDELIAKGLVRRIDPERGGSIRVALRPAFYTMDEETRRKYAETIYAYAFDGSSVNDTVILRDAQHGNEIGQYNPYRGGLKMYK